MARTVQEDEQRVQEGKIFVEAPLSTYCFFLNMTSTETTRFDGEIINLFYDAPVRFFGLDDAILQINRMVDELGCPQTTTPLRSFDKRKTQKQKLADDIKLLRELEQRQQDFWDKKFLDIPKAKRYQIQIVVLRRQNTTWQGTVILNSPQGLKSQNFRSVLELMNLIRSGYRRYFQP